MEGNTALMKKKTYDLALVNVMLFDKREPHADNCFLPAVPDPVSLRPAMTESRSPRRDNEFVSSSTVSCAFLSCPNFLVRLV